MKFSTVIRSLAWSSLESIGISILLFFTVIVLARILGPEEFGIASMALGLVFIPQIIVERLFHDAIIQRRELNQSHLDSAFCVSIGITILITLGVWTSSPLLAKVYGEPRLSSALQLSSCCLLFNGVSAILIANLRRQMLFKVLAFRNLIAAFIGAIIGLSMVINGFGLLSIIAQQVVQAFVGMVVIFASVDRLPRLRFSYSHLKDLLGFSTIAIASDIIWNSQLRLFLVVLGYQSGLVTVGYFEMASRLVNTIRNIWLNAINPVVLSAFSKLQTNKAALRNAFHQVTEINATIAIPLFAGLFVTAFEINSLVLGQSWIASTPVIEMISLAALVSSIRQFSPVIFNSLGRPHYNLIMALIGLITPTVALLLLMPTSLVDQGSIWVGRLMITIPIGLWFTYKILSLRPLEQFKGVGGALAASLIMVCVLWTVKTTLLLDMTNGVVLLIQFILGLLVYSLLLIFFSPHIILRWSRIIKEIRGK